MEGGREGLGGFLDVHSVLEAFFFRIKHIPYCTIHKLFLDLEEASGSYNTECVLYKKNLPNCTISEPFSDLEIPFKLCNPKYDFFNIF